MLNVVCKDDTLTSVSTEFVDGSAVLSSMVRDACDSEDFLRIPLYTADSLKLADTACKHGVRAPFRTILELLHVAIYLEHSALTDSCARVVARVINGCTCAKQVKETLNLYSNCAFTKNFRSW